MTTRPSQLHSKTSRSRSDARHYLIYHPSILDFDQTAMDPKQTITPAQVRHGHRLASETAMAMLVDGSAEILMVDSL
jgi:hypothetical protein